MRDINHWGVHGAMMPALSMAGYKLLRGFEGGRGFGLCVSPPCEPRER
jgi:hypothetical protein